MFEVIDPVLRIESCNLSDLTGEEVNCFLGQWEKGAKISSLMAFYKNDGTFVLNKDNKNYKEILEFCKDYMTATEEERQEVKEQIVSWGMELIEVLDNCLKSRYITEEIRITRCQYIKHQSEIDVLTAIRERYKHSIQISMMHAYMYGKIQGKREERARRKVRSSKPQNIKEEIIKNVNDTQYSKSLEQLLVLSKILSKKCKGVEYAESLSWKEQMIGFIIDDLMKSKERHINMAHGFINALCSK